MSDFSLPPVADDPRERPAPNSRYTPPKPRPVEREAARLDGNQGDELVPIDWHGVTLHVPATADDMDIDVIESFETGKAVGSMRQIFGARQFADARKQFERLNGRRPKVRDFNQLVEAVFDVWGLERGE